MTAERTSIASALRAAADTLTQLADQIENEEGRPFEALSALESTAERVNLAVADLVAASLEENAQADPAP